MLKSFCSSRMVFICTILTALLFAGSLLLAFWGIPKIIKSQIHAQTRLENGTDQWNRFVQIPFPLEYSVRFFEVTNVENVTNFNVKPILKETEPIKYRLTVARNKIRSDDFEEDSVTYEGKYEFDFDPSSGLNQSSEVTIVNPLLMAALQLSSDVQRLALAGCLDIILGQPNGMNELFITKPVHQLMFDGITFGFANETRLGTACRIVRSKMAEKMSHIRVIENINGTQAGHDYFRISFFNYKTENYVKDSVDGVFTINRGIDNMTAVGNIMRWNGLTRISKYGIYGNPLSINNDTCEIVRGTDGTIFHPQLREDEALTVYNTDLCRFVKLTKTDEAATYKGITGYKFTTGSSLFRQATLLPENDCYCSKATKDVEGKDDCYLDGVFDFKPCLGAPLLVSQPHFLHADAKYKEYVENLHPVENDHEIFVLIEPNTGTPLQGMKRIQMNSIFRKMDLLSFITPVTMHEGVIPILWLQEGVSLTDEYVDLLNNQYFNKVKLADGLKYALIATFATTFAACVFLLWRKNFFKKSKKAF